MNTSGRLVVDGLSKDFDGVKAIDEVSFAVHAGEIVGLIGPNGAGKTTLFNVMMGITRADSGTVCFHGQAIHRWASHRISKLGVARSFQIVRVFSQLTVIDNILIAMPHSRRAISDSSGTKWGFGATGHEDNEASLLIESVGLSQHASTHAGELSYGQQKLLSVLMCIAAGADLLLLDEPVSGLAPAMRQLALDMARQAGREGRSVMLIEHDIEAVKEACTRIIFMDAGKKICDGTPEAVLGDPRVLDAYLE